MHGDPGAVDNIVVGVADLDVAISLWVETFGLTILRRQDTADADLARIWGLQADAIPRQALVGMPDAVHGRLHLVEFAHPNAPVRETALATDCCPKSLDVHTEDLPDRMRLLQAQGHQFRSPVHHEVSSPGGLRFREAHMPAHDALNVVLLEVLGQPVSVSPQGFAAIGLLITIVPDAELEKTFYASVLGLEKLMQNILEGPEVEAMIGLPPGAALDASIWGNPGDALGQVEIIEYRGVRGANLYPRAQPPATGILQIAFKTANLSGLRRRLHDSGTVRVEHGTVETLAMRGDTLSFTTPAGLKVTATAA
ncbi:MAG: hypothetical protein R3F24_02850 [Gammaproteobacteria bacterium]